MRTVLLIADLEGITGVEAIESLVIGSEGYLAAALRMTQEVALVARLLLGAGVRWVRISDAHRSGADTNLDASLLPEGCEVRVERDMYGGALLDDIEAVACVGMHASGRSLGFGAHTVSLNTAWSLGGQPLTETHVARLLAAERGVPMWFSSGDDVLERELADGVPFVCTKASVGPDQACSRPLADVQQGFVRVIAGRVAPLPPVPRASLEIRFQRAAEAEAAAQAGGQRVSPTTVLVAPGTSFEAQYEVALRCVVAADPVMLSRVSGFPGTRRFAKSAAGLLLDTWD